MKKKVIDHLPPILKENLSSLKKTSFDQTAREYMCESELSTINFDKLPKIYSRGKKWPCMPQSNDALYIDTETDWYFVEFKNGTIAKADLFRKIYDSIILMLEEKIIPDLDFTRKNLEYILVYNIEQYPLQQQSVSRNRIYEYMLCRAKKEHVLFELDHLDKYLLRKAHTYTKSEFQEKFINVMAEKEQLL